MNARKIIKIDESKCNGCGLCVNACHESAIEMVDGKAKLVSDIYCDGLGDCLPNCPTGAIEIIEREAVEYSQEAVDKRVSDLEKEVGSFGKFKISVESGHKSDETVTIVKSELRQWPVQINLINPNAEFLNNADILIAADCTAYAYGDFHKDFVKGRVVMIGCPKLDDNQHYENKFELMFSSNNIKSITVVRMEVPCCSGITGSVRKALSKLNKEIPYNEVTIKSNGQLA
jgi:Fe-S-cluster-containing hydrogenase component 2